MAAHDLRNIFLRTIVDKVDGGEDIYITSSDLAAACLDDFRINHKDNFVSVGIAEQNLISVSAGMALSGKKVVAYTLNPFLIFRAFDQIRNCIGMMNLPVILAGVNAGLDDAKDGSSHSPLEDLNILRSIPHLQIINASDISLAKWTADNISTLSHPIYIRFDRRIDAVYTLTDEDKQRGYRILNRADNAKVCLLTTGIMSTECLALLKDISGEKSVTLVDVFSFPFDADAIAEFLTPFDHIVTVEEMMLQGGLGSAILETLADRNILKSVKRFGIDLKNGFPSHYGSREWNMLQGGLDMNKLRDYLGGLSRDS